MDGTPTQYGNRITAEEYEREAVEYTTAMVEQLNAAVREQPSLGAASTFFQDPANVKAGLPVFQGKHTRFVYDSDDEEIVAAVDVTHTPLPGPQVRTLADADSDDDEEEADDEDRAFGSEEEEEEIEVEDDEMEGTDLGVANEFYVDPSQAINDATIGALLEDVAMELASFDISALPQQKP